MRRLLSMALALAVAACGNSNQQPAGGSNACAGMGGANAGGATDAGKAGTSAGSDPGSTLPDCRGEWPAEWVAKEQAVVAAVNALRTAGGTCEGVAFDPVPALSNPRLAPARTILAFAGAPRPPEQITLKCGSSFHAPPLAAPCFPEIR